MIARHMVSLPEINRVICILPSSMIRDGNYLLPFHCRRESKKLYLLTPNYRMIPKKLIPSSLNRLINENLRDYSIKVLLKSMGFSKENTIMWMFPPHKYIYTLIDLIPHRLLITHIIDNHLHKRNESADMLEFSRDQYKYLSGKSHMLITSSRQNHEYFSSLNSNCYYFENALDEKFIADPSSLPWRKGKGRPRLGYIGWITQRTDLDLLLFVAKNRPDYDIIIAGPLENGIDLGKSGLPEIPNVYLEGSIPYLEVPEFLTSLDVCLIPHKDSPYSRSMNPLKVYQYLASGRPIVSTEIAGIERWGNMISIAGNYQDFVEKIDEAVHQDSQEASLQRVKAVKQDTWDFRVNQMFQTISRHIQGN